jgi:hypothetical protein
VLGGEHAQGALDHVAEGVGDEGVGPLLVERELDPAARRRSQVDRLRVVADGALESRAVEDVPIMWEALQMLGPA